MEKFPKNRKVQILPTTSAIYGVTAEHSELKLRNQEGTHEITHTDLECELVTSLLMTAIQIGEISKLVWITGLFKQITWADSLYFLSLVLFSVSTILTSSQSTLCPSSNVCWTNFDVSQRPFFRLRLCSPMRTAIWLLPHSQGMLSSHCAVCHRSTIFT
jgi:hypothetical protein